MIKNISFPSLIWINYHLVQEHAPDSPLFQLMNRKFLFWKVRQNLFKFNKKLDRSFKFSITLNLTRQCGRSSQGLKLSRNRNLPVRESKHHRMWQDNVRSPYEESPNLTHLPIVGQMVEPWIFKTILEYYCF